MVSCNLFLFIISYLISAQRYDFFGKHTNLLAFFNKKYHSEDKFSSEWYRSRFGFKEV